MTEENNNKDEKVDEPTVEDAWLIRPCTFYEDEYDDCTSIRARFHQYFIFGKFLDCSQWKRDCDNCYRWKENNDVKSAKELVAAEKARRRERLSSHYNNNVWTRRKGPPENWNSPLPEHILKEYESSYLNIKSKEMKGESSSTIDPSDYCVLM